VIHFLRQHRILKILAIVILSLAFIILAVPYLVPLADNPPGVPLETLVSDNGKFLNIENCRIYVEEEGPLSSPEAVVFLHGFGGSTFSWRNSTPFFASKGYRVLSLDMKGFGLSTKDFESDYSHRSQAKIIAAVLDRLHIGHIYLVGHSMGTSVMLHFAHLYPEKVLGLVSVDGAVILETGSRLPASLLSFGPFQRAGRVFLTHYLTKDRFQAILESAYYRKDVVSPEVVDGYYNRAVIGNWDQSLLAMTRDMSQNVISFPLESIKSSTLIIRGENDTWVTRADMDRWKDRIPNAEFYPVPECGHLPMEERPELFNERILTFFNSLKS